VLLALFCAAPASVGAHRRHHAVKRVADRMHEDPPADDHPLDPKEECVKLCKADKGTDADPEYCNTECAVYNDLNNHHWDDDFGNQEALQRFTEDEATNEAGGKEMEEKFEEEFGEEVLDCTPTVDTDKEPTMDDLDAKKDGVIDKDEAEAYGKKACVPDEMTDQIFEEADADQDNKITEEEFQEAGEDTVAEEKLDEALEGSEGDTPKGEAPFEGDDENAVVDNVDFDEVDDNKDGKIDEAEFHENAEFEAEKRTETNAAHVPVSNNETDMVADASPAVAEAMDAVDTDDDGTISKEEYESTEGGGSDMGEELSEAAGVDEDMPDPDDAQRVQAAEAAPPSLLSKSKVTKPRHKMIMLQRNKRGKKSFAAAFHAAQQHHAKLRKQRSHARRTRAHRRNHGHLRRHHQHA